MWHTSTSSHEPREAAVAVKGRGRSEPKMTLPRSVAEILGRHVTLELECTDRLYLNVFVPLLQTTGGIAHFLKTVRDIPLPSSKALAETTTAFLEAIQAFATAHGIPIIEFRKGQRKEDVAKEYRKTFSRADGVFVIGKAQEKSKVVSTERRRNPQTGATYPWLVDTTRMVNQYYFYGMDDDFGPFFLKFCSYFPYNAKLCINGHEYLKRQLTKRGIAYEELDNGLLSCADPVAAQDISDELSAEAIDGMARKWFRVLPHPFPASDRQAGIRYDISILQAEFSLTQVFDRPVAGRIFFEQVIRDNLDIGRPDRVQLVFGRRVTRATPGRFRTRVIVEGVSPSLHFYYKCSHIKQYLKEGRALRTETTINNAKDFLIGKRLHNFSELRKVGLQANRRLLDVQRISHDSTIGQEAFDRIHRPALHDRQRAASLRFGDPRVLALLAALAIFRLLPRGFSNRDLRSHVAPLLGLSSDEFTQGKMTYDLRRLRLHGLIERVPRSHRYRVTDFGFRAGLFITRVFNRLLRPGLADLTRKSPPDPTQIQGAIEKVDLAIRRAWEAQQVAA
jgi:hypothetical protein